MDKQRLMELAGVELNEADTPEQERRLAENAYRTLTSILNELERVESKISNKSLIVTMDKLGLVHERESVEKAVNAAINEFGDFMPGLEMQKKGE